MILESYVQTTPTFPKCSVRLAFNPWNLNFYFDSWNNTLAWSSKMIVKFFMEQNYIKNVV